jgi:O-acetyl-ADP-ribose deacetylase (regulator of RNase III)
MKARLKILKGDITQLKVDAIVNAANTTLLGGGGVDGAIHHAAGPDLLDECKKLGGCQIGHAKLTSGYRLQAKYIIHTVGPVWRGGSKGEPQLLSACYESSLSLALQNGFKNIAFSAISCGVYGYPVTQAAAIAINETVNFLKLHNVIESVTFVCFDETVFDAYHQAFDALSHE